MDTNELKQTVAKHYDYAQPNNGQFLHGDWFTPKHKDSLHDLLDDLESELSRNKELEEEISELKDEAKEAEKELEKKDAEIERLENQIEVLKDSRA